MCGIDDVHILTKDEQKKTYQDTHYSIHRLRLLGILWCSGTPEEKAEEFYNIL